MIRQRIRLRPVLSLLLVVFGLLGELCFAPRRQRDHYRCAEDCICNTAERRTGPLRYIPVSCPGALCL